MESLNRRPNFFIVGAPKAGTTALAFYLGKHPNVFMSNPKGPHYYATDFHNRLNFISDESEYLNLFKHASPCHIMLGDASVHYLYSKCAIENIWNSDNNAKIIIMIRNPVEMVPSLYNQLLYSFVEDEPHLEVAWSLQESRKRGNDIPKNCKFVEILQYGDQCKTGYQIERALKHFPSSQIHYVLFDNFRTNPKREYVNVLTFLGLGDDHRNDFSIVNPRKSHKSASLGRLLLSPPRVLLFIRKIMGIRQTGIWSRLIKLATNKATPTPIRPEFRAELVSYFTDDIKLTSRLTGFNLDHWLT